ncbi:MAG: ferrous iron transport protein A [Lachnoclostridium sp.]|nr:ferrous iron transport protein A [Lachnoclostridium sp.]
MVLPLSNINPGTSGKVVFLGNDERMAGRLRDLGFTSGAQISCVMKRPKGNIAAYLVRNAVIALREEDSRLIFVEECSEDFPTGCLSSASSSPDPEVIL